ncbi:hypothetical protein [Bacteroides stercoris]|uniref:hypothetical protein n=1 Tax=Bacteroides stercoris TaxID=46506 RepID=UPI00319E5D51
MKGGKIRKIVDELTDMLFPTDMKMEIRLKGICTKGRPSDRNNPQKRIYLGTNSHLE